MPELEVEAPDGTRASFALVRDRVRIGRGHRSDLLLSDPCLSRAHAEIRRDGGGFLIRDLGSRNGTFVNGERVSDERLLRDGDRIALGEHALVFFLEADGSEEEHFPGAQAFAARDLCEALTRPALDGAGLARRARRLRVVSDAAAALLQKRPLQELFDTLLDLVFRAVACERAAILLLEGSPPQPRIRASRARRGRHLVTVSRSITRRVLEDRVSLLLPNVLEHAFFGRKASLAASGVRSAMCVPLWFTAGPGEKDSVIGLVYVDTLASSSFEEEDLRVLTTLANLAATRLETVRLLEEQAEKDRMADELRRAAEVQAGLLPSCAPEIPGYRLSGVTRPCRAVGGDYYDYARGGDGLLLAIGDVAGKGAGAALLMALLRATVREHWAEGSLAEAMARINARLRDSIPEGRYATLFLARLDLETGRGSYINAGHNAPVLVRAGSRAETLAEGGPVVGLLEDAAYREGPLALLPGDTLVAYSDGITETLDASGAEFGEAGVVETALWGSRLPLDALTDALLRAVDAHAGGARASDDRTLLLLRREGEAVAASDGRVATQRLTRAPAALAS